VTQTNRWTHGIPVVRIVYRGLHQQDLRNKLAQTTLIENLKRQGAGVPHFYLAFYLSCIPWEPNLGDW